MLDAGTGVESLRWVATLACDWDQTVAVTASQPMRDRMLRELGEEAAMEGRLGDILVCHNWSRIQGECGGGDKGGSSASSSDAGAHGDGPGADVSGVKANNGGGEVGVQPAVSRAMGQFDTVLADYLFGSLEYFWPYSEDNPNAENMRQRAFMLHFTAQSCFHIGFGVPLDANQTRLTPDSPAIATRRARIAANADAPMPAPPIRGHCKLHAATPRARRVNACASRYEFATA